MQSILVRSAAAATLALALTTAASAQNPSGYFGADISQTEIDTPLGDDDFTGYRFGGAYHNNLGSTWNLQFSAAYSYLDTEPDEVDGVGAEFDLFMRDAMSHAFGGFLAVVDGEDSTSWGAGGEAQWYSGNLTFGGTAGWFDGDEAFDSLYGGCVLARLYGTENFAIEGRASLANVDFGPADVDTYGFGAGAEYEFMGSPFSITGDVDYTSADDTDVNATTWMVGGKWHFGTVDLMTRDRQGAGMQGSSCISNAANL